MDLTFEVINGLCFGIEYVSKDLDEDLEESVIIIEIACFRWILWMGDCEE
jgi:energy-converting hydrogenase Eha subunit F